MTTTVSAISAYRSMITFYADTICDFLLAEPIIYIFAGLLSVVVIKVLHALITVNK